MVLQNKVTFKHIEKLGLVKIDILGLRTLSNIDKTIDTIENKHQKPKLKSE